MKRGMFLGAAVLALAAALSASAAVTVLGDSSAHDCSEAAFSGKADDANIRTCDAALDDGSLGARDRAASFINRGVLKMLLVRYDDAMADFQHAIDVYPSLGEGWINRGVIDIIRKRYTDGIADIDRGLQLGSEHPAKAYYNRAIAYEAINDEAAAYRDYQQASQLEPKWDLPRQQLLRFTVTRQ